MSEETNTSEDLVTEFNLETDFKPEPLIPNGTYSGNVIEVKYKADKACIQWTVVLDGNGTYCNDGETQVDGVRLFFNNWLPKKGDENTPTPSGRTTKFQSKVNQLKQFADGMKLNLSTISVIQQLIENGDLIGLAVKATISAQEYPVDSGQFKNQIDKMIAA